MCSSDWDCHRVSLPTRKPSWVPGHSSSDMVKEGGSVGGRRERGLQDALEVVLDQILGVSMSREGRRRRVRGLQDVTVVASAGILGVSMGIELMEDRGNEGESERRGE